MPVHINILLLGHIALDSESKGRFGIQGNTFRNTFGYLNQYLKKCPTLSSSLQTLFNQMDDLINREDKIAQIRVIQMLCSGLSERSVQKTLTLAADKQLEQFLINTTEEILALNRNQSLLIPGGWTKAKGSGHAMIYELERNDRGELLFHIYNTGAGIEYHEKASAKKRELFSPTKTYHLPEPVSKREIQALIKRLVLPMTGLRRRSYNAEIIYQDIEISLEFMQAELVKKNVHTSEISTAGQLAGTCAQRSIHQVLKASFPSLSAYQKFIFDFKLYAIEDYLNTHKPPRSAQITDLIKRALINNIRILQEPDVFADKVAQDEMLEHLNHLKQRLLTEEGITSSLWPMIPDVSSIGSWFIKTFSHHTRERLDQPISDFEESIHTDVQEPMPQMTTIHSDQLFNDLEEVLAQCQKSTNPMWTIAQIEQVILALPIPSSTSLAPPYYRAIGFYDTIQTANDFERIGTLLDELRQVYEQATDKILHEAILPTEIITYCSFLALRDYFDSRAEQVTGKPSFHGFLHTRLYQYLYPLKDCTFLANHNPVADQRLVNLLTLTHRTRTQHKEKPNYVGDGSALLSLLEEDTDLKAELEKQCTKAMAVEAMSNKIWGDYYHKPEELKTILGGLTLDEYAQQIVEREGFVEGYQRCLFNDPTLLMNIRKHDRGYIENNLPLPLSYYEALLNSEPELKVKLEAVFNSESYLTAQGFSGEERLFDELRRGKITGLYVLFESMDKEGNVKKDSPLSAEELKPLIEKLRQQATLELVLYQYLKPLYSQKEGPEFSCYYYGRSSETREVIRSDFFHPDGRHPKDDWADVYVNYKYLSDKRLSKDDQKHVSHHQYDLKSSRVSCAIEQSYRYDGENSDVIQCDKDPSALIDKNVYFNRDLRHLRTSKEHQIKLTLAYFTRSDRINHLAEDDIRNYIEANLFTPNLLLIAVREYPELLTDFNKFYEKGQKCFLSNGAEAAFLIRLRILLYRYVALENPAQRTLLWDNQETLHKLLLVEKDPLARANLHTYQLWNAVTLFQQDLATDDLLQEAFLSYAYIQANSNPYIRNDTKTLFEQQRVALYLEQWLSTASPQLVLKMLTQIMAMLKLDTTDLHLESHYPIFHYQNKKGDIIYTVNMTQGSVFHNHRALSALPLDIKQHPIVKRLELQDETACWVSEDGKHINFKSVDVRIKRDEASGLIVQKKWFGQWYQLLPLTTEQEKLFNIEHEAVTSTQLPSLLTDSTCETWVNAQGALIVQNQKPIYAIDENGICHQLDDKGQKTGLVLASVSPFEKEITAFENDQFYTINIDDKGNETFYFGRYALSLTSKNGPLKRTHTEDILVNTSAFKSNVGALTFRNGQDEYCQLIVQPFYFDETTQQIPGEYYQLTHDTSLHVANTLLRKDLDPNLETPLLPIWKHHHSARMIMYPMKQGMPAPKTAADALYLCYVYLATHEVEKAWRVLEHIQRYMPLEGTKEELQHLQWIIHGLPIILDEEKDQDARLKTPEFIACQLKALAIYADFKKLGTEAVLEDKKPDSAFISNDLYEQKQTKELKDFQRHLPHLIQELYQTYQKGERHLHEKYQLLSNDRRTLLNTCANKSSTSTDYGALGYERRRLSLETLLNEYQRLVAIQETSAHFPENYVLRLKDIEKKISHEFKVMGQRTDLEWQTLDLRFYGYWDLPGLPPGKKVILQDMCTETLSAAAKTSYQSWRHDFTQILDINMALSVLYSAITPDEFMPYFPTYLHIASHGKVEEISALKSFCMHYLIGFRHANHISSESAMRTLINTLYHVIEKPELLTTLEHQNLDGLIRNIKESQTKTPAPPIQFPQAKDIYDEILTTNQDLWDELKQHSLVHESMPVLQAFYPDQLWSILGMTEALQEYADEEKKYLEAIQSTETEEAAGLLKLACIKQQRLIANKVLSDLETQDTLRIQADALATKQKTSLTRIWKTTLTLANQAPHRAVKWMAEQDHPLSQEELLTLYLKNDLTYYIERTGLSKKDCLKLHQLIHKAVSLEVQHQQVLRVLNAIESKEPQKIATALMSENLPAAQTDSGLMLFQYINNLLIRPRQIEVISSLLSSDDPHYFRNVVEKMIMGGGKSKVILPLLTAKKATGLNLVVIEVPRALLATNHADLNNASQQFGQKAHRFEFNRDSDCSSTRLQSIYNTFVEIMTNRDYLVTTGESMQSLELKYFDLLLSRPDKKENLHEWQQQVAWLSKITKLVKAYGDATIDEVHQAILLKRKLNYTLGQSKAISLILIQHSIALYRWMDVGKEPLNTKQLLTDTSSPLHQLITEMQEMWPAIDVIAELNAYFENNHTPEIVRHAPAEIKDILAFYKAQLELFPKTQSRHYQEHYGSSEKMDSAIACALAIPYLASNQPNERSRFNNPLEVINYSIQGLLQNGMTLNLFQEAITRWQIQTITELLNPQHNYQTLEETETAKRINSLLKSTGLTLESLNQNTVEGRQAIETAFTQLKIDRNLIFAILEEHILPQISIEPMVLQSDAYHHVDLYRSTQGISGTPSNHSTYHQRLQYDHRASFGTDGYIEAILRDKLTPIESIPFTSLAEFVSSLLQRGNNTHAIIDVCAQFAGYSNFQVAQELAKQFTRPQQNIQYILYFNEQDVLCALNIKTNEIHKLTSSDAHEIKEKLGCDPDECFTYYDQIHTLGVDIKQAPKAHAFILADSKTCWDDFSQGWFRMRGADEQQTHSIIVPNDTTTRLDTFIPLMINNQQERLKEDNYYAARAKMKNLIRQNLLQKLNAVPDEDADEKWRMMQSFKEYFIETQDKTLFEQYGQLAKAMPVSELLKQYQRSLMIGWSRCLQQAGMTTSADETQVLDHDMSKIIELALPHCHDIMTSFDQDSQSLGIEVEYEKEMQKQTQKEVQNEVIQADQYVSSKKRFAWGIHRFIADGSNDCIHPLNDISQNKIFSSNLLMHDNFSKVYRDQEDIVCSYLKPVHAILFRKQGTQLSACLIDMQDLEGLHPLIKNEGNTEVWISTTQHHLLSGQFPNDIQHDQNYQSLIEQVRLFDGDLSGLSEQEYEFSWLNQEKLDFFSQHLMPYRQTTSSELLNLDARLSSNTNITLHPKLPSLPVYAGGKSIFFKQQTSDNDSSSNPQKKL